jgi:hypothetical protein
MRRGMRRQQSASPRRRGCPGRRRSSPHSHGPPTPLGCAPTRPCACTTALRLSGHEYSHGWRSCVCAGGLVPAAELRPNPGMPRQAPPSCCNRHSDIMPGAHRSTAPLGAHTGVPPLSDNVRSGSSAWRRAPAAAQVDCGQRAALARPQPARERQPALVARVRPAQPKLARPIRLEAAGRGGHFRPPARAGRARRRAVLWRPVPPSPAHTCSARPPRPHPHVVAPRVVRGVVRCGVRRKRDYRSREEALLRISSNQNSTRPRPHN